ncbi:MAG TPA: GGDEF domain-containing protein [Gemmatimonadaceae bacterium]
MESGVSNALPRGIAALIQESRVAEERGDWSGSRAYLQQALGSPDARRVEGLACVLLRLIARSWRREGDLGAAADACEAAIAAAERFPAAIALTQALAEQEAIAAVAGLPQDARATGHSAGTTAGRQPARRGLLRPLDPEQLSLIDTRDAPPPLPTPGRGFEAIPLDPMAPLRVDAVVTADGSLLVPFPDRMMARGITVTVVESPPWGRYVADDAGGALPAPDALVLDGRSPRLLGEIGELRAQCPDVALLVLGGASALASTLQFLELGVQEVVPRPVTPEQLERVVRLAVARQRRENAVRALALVDPLTGLYNRRGFLTLVRQQEQLALRLDRRMLHLFIDLDGLKRINDTFGHHEGDLALQDTAALLRRTFRESDVIARIGGDEFAVLAVEMDERWGTSWEGRLQEQLAAANVARDRGYDLVLSVGVAAVDPRVRQPLEERLNMADVEMYRVKRVHRGEAPVIPLRAPVDEGKSPRT